MEIKVVYSWLWNRQMDQWSGDTEPKQTVQAGALIRERGDCRSLGNGKHLTTFMKF